MQTGFRFRCYPTPQQAQILRRWIGCQRFIYNAKVSEDRYFRAFARKALALTGQQPPQDQCYRQFITADTAWLRDVPSQAEFVCQRCGHTANADHNASENIRQRGVELIRSGEYRERARKTVMRLRTTEPLGAGSSEVTPGETTVSRGGGNVAVLGSLNQETRNNFV